MVGASGRYYVILPGVGWGDMDTMDADITDRAMKLSINVASAWSMIRSYNHDDPGELMAGVFNVLCSIHRSIKLNPDWWEKLMQDSLVKMAKTNEVTLEEVERVYQMQGQEIIGNVDGN